MRIYYGIGGQYGDIFMGEPILRTLLETHRDAEFIFGCSKQYEDVLPLFHGYHPRVVGYRAWESYPPYPEFFTQGDREYVERMGFDKMYIHSPEHTPKWAERVHQVVEQGVMVGVEVEDPEIRLERHIEVPKRPTTIAMSLFPNNGKGTKQIGIERVREIVSFVGSLGYEVLHLNGPGEPDIDGAQKTNVSFSDAVIAMLGTTLLVTGDTGMSWAASAYDHPTVGLYSIDYWQYCQSSVNWQPINENAVYLEARRAAEIPLHGIFVAIRGRLEE